MIENQKQYEITKIQLEKFQLAVKNFDLESVEAKVGSRKLAEAELKGMESMVEDLTGQMKEYEDRVGTIMK